MTTMRPLLFDVPPLYGTIFTLVAALWAVPELLGALFLRSGAAASKQDNGSYGVLVGGVTLGLLGGFVCATRLPALAVTAARPGTYWFGILCMVVGIALRWYAISTLGRSFTQDVATRASQKIVQAGPYRVVRHPAYSATLLTMLGVGVALANVGSIAIIMLGGLVGILYRIRVEERALFTAFDREYRDYTRRTRRLIPFVW